MSGGCFVQDVATGFVGSKHSGFSGACERVQFQYSVSHKFLYFLIQKFTFLANLPRIAGGAAYGRPIQWEVVGVIGLN